MILPGPQPIYVDKTGASCATCIADVTPNKPHDLVRDCMPVLDQRALYWARKRDEAGAVVLQVIHEEAKSAAGGPSRPARDARTGSSDSPESRKEQP